MTPSAPNTTSEPDFAAAAQGSAMVDYLNSLRTQQEDANATYVHEARQEFLQALRKRAPWFPDEAHLHAATKLDCLAQDLAQSKLVGRMVFLTGDAGDGKTAFCAELARELRHPDELKCETVIGQWHIIKDASEVEEDALRARLVEQLQPASRSTLVVAINEGRLRRLFRGIGADGESLWKAVVGPALESWLDSERAEQLNAAMQAHRVFVFNFRLRFHVRTVVPALIERWSQPAYWEESPACKSCPARERCPILSNVRDLRSRDLQERVSDVLAWCHFSGQRLPFRRMQAVLALATTGGLRCTDLISGALRQEPASSLLRYRFYNALFLREQMRHPVDVRSEPIARAFAPADPGRFVSLLRDRAIDELIRTGSPNSDEVGSTALGGLEAVAAKAMRSSLGPSDVRENVGNLTSELAQLVRSLRRYLSFVQGPPEGLSWRRALGMIEAAAADAGLAEELCHHVVEALNRLHRIEESKRETITGNQIDPAGFRIAARQVLELSLGAEFGARVVVGPMLPVTMSRYLEITPSEIYLEAAPLGWTGEPSQLRLDARLVDILQRVLDGYNNWQALGPYRRDLARFHSRLMALAASAGHEPAMTIRVGAKRYGVSVSVAQEVARLRFEGKG